MSGEEVRMAGGIRTLKVLAALLTYPDREMLGALDEMNRILEEEESLPATLRRDVRGFTEALQGKDLLDLESEYVSLFDQSRSLSLHLFEHVHGESRDRGSAMVDLLTLYRSKGFDLATPELPDYLPLFLEFLSTQPPSEACALLADAVDVVALLRTRLERRGASYAAVFRAIEALAPARSNEEAIRDAVAGEARDDTPEALDKSWTEEPVTFGELPRGEGSAGGGGCPAAAAVVERFAPAGRGVRKA